MTPFIRSLTTAASLMAILPTTAMAQQSQTENLEQLRSTVVGLIKALLDQNIISRQKAGELLRSAGLDESALGASATKPEAGAAAGVVAGAAVVTPGQGVTTPGPVASAPPVVRVPYVPESVREQLKDEVKRDLLVQARSEGWALPNAVPDWVNGLNVYGSVRLRYVSDQPDSSNSSPALVDAFFQLPQGTTRDTTQSNDRFRLRARLGVEARITNDLQAGVRLTTNIGGDESSPVSATVDQGRYNRRYVAAIDLAYLDWSPSPQFSLVGGRFANPYNTLTSDLMWAPDLTFDGFAAAYRPRFSDEWSGLFVLGANPIRQVESSQFSLASDKWLFAAQGLLRWRTKANSLQFGATYYDFSNIQGELNPALPPDNTLYNQTAPSFRQRGNTMFDIAYLSSPTGAPVYGVASKFQVLQLAFNYEYSGFDPLRLQVGGEYLRNYGFDPNEISQRIGAAAAGLPVDRTGATGIENERNMGYRFYGQVGNANLYQFGNWQAFAGYRYLQRDSVPDSFVSTDYRLGGTDQKATFFGVGFGLTKNTWALFRYITASTIDNPVIYSWDTWFLDVEARF